MAAMGLLMAWVSRTPAKRLAILWLLQVPNFLALVLVPIVVSLADTGQLRLTSDLEFSLKLGFAWSAALFVTVPLFSSMRIEEIVDGLDGLRLPRLVGFTVGYAFVLLYSSAADIMRIADAMKVKGLRLESRKPFILFSAALRMTIPAVFTIIRRANTMMAVMELRGLPRIGPWPLSRPGVARPGGHPPARRHLRRAHSSRAGPVRRPAVRWRRNSWTPGLLYDSCPAARYRCGRRTH